MTLKIRLIPCLDVKDGRVVKGVNFGNLRDEELFVRQKLWHIARPGDLVWLEVGLRLEPIENDPLYRLTQPDREESSAEANRRLLRDEPQTTDRAKAVVA